MTLYAFNLLSEEVQPACVYREGHYIARRWDDMHQAMLLYRLPGGLFVRGKPAIGETFGANS